jgi:hypothetical protein
LHQPLDLSWYLDKVHLLRFEGSNLSLLLPIFGPTCCVHAVGTRCLCHIFLFGLPFDHNGHGNAFHDRCYCILHCHAYTGYSHLLRVIPHGFGIPTGRHVRTLRYRARPFILWSPGVSKRLVIGRNHEPSSLLHADLLAELPPRTPPPPPRIRPQNSVAENRSTSTSTLPVVTGGGSVKLKRAVSTPTCTSPPCRQLTLTRA